MKLCKWEDLPEFMQCDEVKAYYDLLLEKQIQLKVKRIFDVVMAAIILIILAIPMMIIGILIKVDSKGPVFYRQDRVTTYGKTFRIHKFRTMVDNADKLGSAVTVDSDIRITKIGSKIRNLRIDELPQVIDVLMGNMSFVGTRPEAVKYVKYYTKEMYATLLMPAGITSEASIKYKNEAELLCDVEDVDKVYVGNILPQKMKYNLESVRNFSFFNEMITLFRTILAVLGKKY